MATNEVTTFICLFHSQDHAEAALNALENAGFSRAAITSTWRQTGTTATEDYTQELTRLGVPDRDLDRMTKGIAKGGVVISLEAPEDRSDEIESIFHKYSAEKIDEADLERKPSTPPVAPFVAAPLVAAAASESAYANDTAVVPVVQEELLVGKREVDRGGVRVFQRVVEEPVSENVSLHEEHVVIERHAVDRAVTNADLNAGDQTIELVETDEVPVISKVARVVEEVRVGVVGSEHTQTVQDTVRHTEVELEPLPDAGFTETSGTSTTRKTL